MTGGVVGQSVLTTVKTTARLAGSALVVCNGADLRVLEVCEKATQMFGEGLVGTVLLDWCALSSTGPTLGVQIHSAEVSEDSLPARCQILGRTGLDVDVAWLWVDASRVAFLFRISSASGGASQLESELADSLEAFDLAFNHSPVGLAFSDWSGTIDGVNPAFCRMIGYTEAELLGRSVREFTHPDDVAREAEWAKQVLGGEIESYALHKRYVHRDGSSIDVLMHLVAFERRGVPRVMAQVLDITAYQRARVELERTRQLAVLGRMAAAVGHDINNPAGYLMLNLGELEALVQELPQPHRQDAVQVLRDCTMGVSRIAAIVEDLRQVSPTESSGAVPVDLEEVAHLSCRMASHEVDDVATLSVEFEPLPMLMGDPTKLGQLVTNLVINAATAVSRVPGDHRIEVRGSQRDNWVMIEVMDTGPGLPENTDELFDAFVRGGSSGGRGLGLWICSEIVKQHEGTITAVNRPEGGACFEVRLPTPRSAVQHGASEQVEKTQDTFDHISVLLIDDDLAMRRALKRSIGRRHNVVACDNAVDAVEIIRTGRRFDVVICDLMMPVMSGVEFVDAVQEFDEAQADRIVVATGGAVGEQPTAFLERFMGPVLRKPATAVEIFDAIDVVVGHHGLWSSGGGVENR